MNNQNRPPQPEGTSWDEETQQWLTPEQLLELAGDFVISENEFWDNLTDEELNGLLNCHMVRYLAECTPA